METEPRAIVASAGTWSPCARQMISSWTSLGNGLPASPRQRMAPTSVAVQKRQAVDRRLCADLLDDTDEEVRQHDRHEEHVAVLPGQEYKQRQHSIDAVEERERSATIWEIDFVFTSAFALTRPFALRSSTSAALSP